MYIYIYIYIYIYLMYISAGKAKGGTSPAEPFESPTRLTAPSLEINTAVRRIRISHYTRLHDIV